MAHNIDIHPTQIQILVTLLFHPHATFGELLQQTDLTSDHFNFHLKSLVKQGYVSKNNQSAYTLTPTGKEHANRLDTENYSVERQPKSTVLLHIIQENQSEPRILVQQRLKQPYYGFWCIPGGKIRWGETIIEAAHRELVEETGLTCDNIEFKGIYHKIDYVRDSDKLLEDKIFFNVLCLNPSGQLSEEFEGGRNKFMTKSEIAQLNKSFGGLDMGFDMLNQSNIFFTEKKHFYSSDEY